MSRPPLRYEAGGDPTQGPVRELAADAPTPDELNDFPDAPDAPNGPVQDQPDRNAFAARLGLRPRRGRDGAPTSDDDLGADRDVDRGTDGPHPRGATYEVHPVHLVVSGSRNAAARAVGTAGVALRGAAALLDRIATSISSR